MLKRVRDFLHLHDHSEKPKGARRPATITDNEDGTVYTRQPNGIYESSGRKFLSMTKANEIIAAGGDKTHTVSKEEAPDFHASEKPALVLHRGGILIHPLVGDK